MFLNSGLGLKVRISDPQMLRCKPSIYVDVFYPSNVTPERKADSEYQ